MIIRKFTYDSMLDLISQQRNQISQQRKEIEKLNKRIDFLSTELMVKQMRLNEFMSAPSDINIDFPNTTQKGGNSANTGTDDINDIFNL